MSEVRLQKYLAECGIASRRACEQIIREGRVTVNDVPAELGQQINPDNARIIVDGKPVNSDDKIYIVLNKPPNVITTMSDTHGRKSVTDLLNGIASRVFPVGRLDRDVEGVLLLTNDGELAYRLMHPKFQVKKTYLAWVKGHMKAATAIRLEKGVHLDDGMTAPANVVILNAGREISLIKLTLHEGRKREVKRMCAAVGHPVETLHRIAFATVQVKGLRPGEWRYLSSGEIKRLQQCVGMQ